MRTRAYPSRLTGWAAAILLLWCAANAGAEPAHPSWATPRQREQAQSRFERGRKLMRQGNFAGAIHELRASMDIVASPNARLLAARCLRKSDRLVEAYAEFGRTSVEARELRTADPRYARAEQEALRERSELQQQLGFIHVTVLHATGDSQLRVAGELIRRAAWTEAAPVLPGGVEVEVVTPGRKVVRRKATVGAGERITIDLDTLALQVASPPRAAGAKGGTDYRPWGYAAGALGLAGLGTFAVAGLRSRSIYEQLLEDCGAGPCPSSRADEVRTGKMLQTTANIGLAVGVVGVVSGATLLWIGGRSGSGRPRAAVVLRPDWAGVQGQLW